MNIQFDTNNKKLEEYLLSLSKWHKISVSEAAKLVLVEGVSESKYNISEIKETPKFIQDDCPGELRKVSNLNEISNMTVESAQRLMNASLKES